MFEQEQFQEVQEDKTLEQNNNSNLQLTEHKNLIRKSSLALSKGISEADNDFLSEYSIGSQTSSSLNSQNKTIPQCYQEMSQEIINQQRPDQDGDSQKVERNTNDIMNFINQEEKQNSQLHQNSQENDDLKSTGTSTISDIQQKNLNCITNIINQQIDEDEYLEIDEASKPKKKFKADFQSQSEDEYSQNIFKQPQINQNTSFDKKDYQFNQQLNLEIQSDIPKSTQNSQNYKSLRQNLLEQINEIQPDKAINTYNSNNKNKEIKNSKSSNKDTHNKNKDNSNYNEIFQVNHEKQKYKLNFWEQKTDLKSQQVRSQISQKLDQKPPPQEIKIKIPKSEMRQPIQIQDQREKSCVIQIEKPKMKVQKQEVIVDEIEEYINSMLDFQIKSLDFCEKSYEQVENQIYDFAQENSLRIQEFNEKIRNFLFNDYSFLIKNRFHRSNPQIPIQYNNQNQLIPIHPPSKQEVVSIPQQPQQNERYLQVQNQSLQLPGLINLPSHNNPQRTNYSLQLQMQQQQQQQQQQRRVNPSQIPQNTIPLQIKQQQQQNRY